MPGRISHSPFNARGPVMPTFGKAAQRVPNSGASVPTSGTPHPQLRGTSWWASGLNFCEAVKLRQKESWGEYGDKHLVLKVIE